MFCAKEGKTIYRTIGEARAAIRGRKADGRATTNDLHVYQCGDHFHLTKQVLVKGKYTVPKLKVRKTDGTVSDGEWRNIRNRVADLTRQFAKEEDRNNRKRFQELNRIVAEDKLWLARMKDAAEYHEACAAALRKMLDAMAEAK